MSDRTKEKKSLRRIVSEGIIFGTFGGIANGIIIDTTQYGANESFERAFPYIVAVGIATVYTIVGLIHQNNN